MSFENWEKFVADTKAAMKDRTPAATGNEKNSNKSNTLKKRQETKKETQRDIVRL